jgi:16S rRNA (uracil1498-N3)-methyltransferase
MAGRPSDAAAPWRRAVAQVRVPDLTSPLLDGDDLHHLARVLRLRAGAEICLTDGAGGWRLATFDGADSPEPTTEIRHEPAPDAPVSVAFAPVKAARPELVVEKLTEIGVDRIVLLVTERSVVRWDAERAAKQFARLRRVAVEACAQSRRLWVPEIGMPDGPDTPIAPNVLWGSDADGAAAGVAVAEPGGRPVSAADRMLLVGPEGGWSPDELADATGAGAGRVDLGDHVLRSETAAIVAGVHLTLGRRR